MTRLASRISEKTGSRMLHPSRDFNSHQVQCFSQRLADKVDDAQVEQSLFLVLLGEDPISMVKEAEALSERECVFRQRCRLESHNHLTRNLIQSRGGIHELPDIIGSCQ